MATEKCCAAIADMQVWGMTDTEKRRALELVDDMLSFTRMWGMTSNPDRARECTEKTKAAYAALRKIIEEAD